MYDALVPLSFLDSSLCTFLNDDVTLCTLNLHLLESKHRQLPLGSKESQVQVAL